jgi:hypothetical protein
MLRGRELLRWRDEDAIILATDGDVWKKSGFYNAENGNERAKVSSLGSARREARRHPPTPHPLFRVVGGEDGAFCDFIWDLNTCSIYIVWRTGGARCRICALAASRRPRATDPALSFGARARSRGAAEAASGSALLQYSHL